MNCSFVRLVFGTLLLLLVWTSFARPDPEGGFKACIGQYREHCGMYSSLTKLEGTFDCGTSVDQVGKSICKAVSKADPEYDGRYKASIISHVPGNRCGYALVYVYCYHK